MTARANEQVLLRRCLSVPRGATTSAENQLEAKVFRLATLVIQSKFSQESMKLMEVSDRYFVTYPREKLATVEVIRCGWVINLRRVRDRLIRKIEEY